ncbi:MAG: nucleotidyltransferase family protein [Gemmatimonadota bacterium]|nr:nucleotidyltransferase family protein [Gemmatimonadota bacterium]
MVGLVGERAGAGAGRGRGLRNGRGGPGMAERATGQATADVPEVAAVVLAAGASTRMGRNKLLLELDGETVVRRAVRTAIAAGLSPVVVVTGHACGKVAGQLRGLGCSNVHNDRYVEGTHTSVAAGIGAVGEGCGAAVVILADMPFVTPAMLRTLVDTYREARPPLVASRYGGSVNAPPILYDRRLFGELRRMDARCGREVVRRHLHEAIEVEWSAEAGRDLDRPDDYRRIVKELAGGKDGGRGPVGRVGGPGRSGDGGGAGAEAGREPVREPGREPVRG